MDGMSPCRECGMPLSDGRTCGDLLMELLAMESESTELQSLHYYNVATYNIQHPAAFDPEAYAIMRAAFIEAVDGGWNAHDARRELKRRLAPFDGPRKVLRPEADRVIVPRAWSRTIADAVRRGDPAATAAQVKEWAKSVRMELS